MSQSVRGGAEHKHTRSHTHGWYDGCYQTCSQPVQLKKNTTYRVWQWGLYDLRIMEITFTAYPWSKSSYHSNIQDRDGKESWVVEQVHRATKSTNIRVSTAASSRQVLSDLMVRLSLKVKVFVCITWAVAQCYLYTPVHTCSFHMQTLMRQVLLG